MKVIIIGAGIMGSTVARCLLKENHEVCFVESDEATATRVQDKYDAKVIIGNGSDPEVLKKAGVSDADIVLAVTSSDEINVVICSLADYLGSKQQIARVRSASFNDILKKEAFKSFSFDKIINPEYLATQSILKIVATPGMREVADFADGRILFRSINVASGSPLCGAKIEDLRNEDFPWPFLIIAILRKGNVIIPKGDAVIEPLDRIYVLLPVDSFAEFLTYVNPEVMHPKKVIIHGATDIGRKVAVNLSQTISDVFIIEEDVKIANEFVQETKSIKVVNDSASDSEVLKECGIEVADVFIACSKNDHSNLVSAVLAKRMGAKITIITTQEPDYISIADSLSIDAIINPQTTAAYQIVSILRGKEVNSVVKLMDIDVEALELVPEIDAPITKGLIKSIKFPKNSIIGAVCGENSVSLVNGDTKIQAKQKVIAFCQDVSAKKLQDMFIKKGLF